MSDFLRIGELSVRTGKTRRTLHFYEELGLLTPASRTQGGFRQYDDASVQRVHWIGRLQDLGFSLPEIREFLESLHAQEQGPEAMEALRQLYLTKHTETRAQIERLEALAGELQDSLQYLDECKQCAPTTPRLACHDCDEHSTDEPLLVAAVRPSSPPQP